MPPPNVGNIGRRELLSEQGDNAHNPPLCAQSIHLRHHLCNRLCSRQRDIECATHLCQRQHKEDLLRNRLVQHEFDGFDVKGWETLVGIGHKEDGMVETYIPHHIQFRHLCLPLQGPHDAVRPRRDHENPHLGDQSRRYEPKNYFWGIFLEV